MILRRLSLSHWRNHAQLDLSFGAGFNVVLGRNEAGKSSLVEALDWALYRDITGARLTAGDIKSIVPANEPGARPRVEAEIEFCDCVAVVSKTLAEDSGKRECRLTIRVPGVADQFFERTEAQNRLRALFGADGLGEDKGASAESGLLVAHQGEGVEFLRDGSSAIRSTLGVSSEGELALTTRLEKARVELEKLKTKEFLQVLTPLALEAARAGTDAAKARDEAKIARDELAKLTAMSGEIEVLREEIGDLREKLADLGPQQEAAQTQVEAMSARHNAQLQADKKLSDLKLACQNAVSLRDELGKRVGEIARLSDEQNRAQIQLESLETGLDELENVQNDAQKNFEICEQKRETSDANWNAAREHLGKWRVVLEVFEAQTRAKDEERSLAILQQLGADLASAQSDLDQCAPAPDALALRELRALWDALGSLEIEAARGLCVEISAKNPARLKWKADGGVLEILALENEEKAILNAMARGDLLVPSVGILKITSGARGVDELKIALEAAGGELASKLAPWNAGLGEMPDVLERLESCRRDLDDALKCRDEAAKRLKDEEAHRGGLHDAQGRLEEAKSEFAARREEAKSYEGALQFSGLKRAQVREKVEDAAHDEREKGAVATRARNDFERAANDCRVAERALNDARNLPGQLRAAMGNRAAQLERLRDDEHSDEARENAWNDAQNAAIKAEIARDDAREKRADLGDSTSLFKVDAARRHATKLGEERVELEKRLAEIRRDLFHLCEADPETRRAQLEADLERLEPEIARHEARLRGLALLAATLEAQRTKLGRDLAGPLNAKLAPWLSHLRGKETELVFSDDGAKLEKVRTKNGESTIELPFSDHSEGMKEQVAFALRLILAARVAQNLPSQRLCVVLDDPFTQSDSSRRDGLGQVLKDALKTLQIVFVSCHGAPKIEGIETNRLLLGEWSEDAQIERKPEKVVKSKTEKPKVKKETAILAETIEAREEAGTLALF